MNAELHSPFDQAEQKRRDRIDAAAFKGGMELEDARMRHAEILTKINRDISRFTDGGKLIAVPYCPSACQPGPFSDFLVTLRINPFARVNMFYFASDLQTALYLDTCLYDPDACGRHDAELVAYYQSKMQLWFDFKANEPNADVQFIADMRDAIQAEVVAEMAEIETIIHGDKTHTWRGYFGERISQAV